MPVEHRQRGKGYEQKPVSNEMSEGETNHEEAKPKEHDPETMTVYTGAGCIKVQGGTRAGYGIYWGERDETNESRALRGREQTAQRAEVAVVASALMRARIPMDIVSDSRYTVDGTQNILSGNTPKACCRHKELWQQIYRRRQIT